MHLSYAIKFEDFRSLQPPFTIVAGKNTGFKGALVACALIVALGVFCFVQDLGLLVAGFLVGLGGAAGTGACFYELRSVRHKKEQYEKSLVDNFQKIHCRDQRNFAFDESGYSVSCNCGTVTRPWTELASFAENPTHFAFITKMDTQVIPKSAFPSPADITEFRALVSEKVHRDKPVTAPYIDFAFRPEDYRAANRLHVVQGGGWRRLAKIGLTAAISTWGCFVIWKYVSTSRDPVVLGGLLALLVIAPSYGALRRRRNKKYFGPLRVYFTDESLNAQYPATQSRRPWSQFIGYLENSDVILLYLSPAFYTILPKRALGAQAGRLEPLLKAKVKAYDYRNPNLPVSQQIGSLPQTS
jgi:YcxB-like protein